MNPFDSHDPWQELHWWLFRRDMLRKWVPKDIFEHDDTTVADTLKLVDVAIRDTVRRINKMLLHQGMPNLSQTYAPTNQPGQTLNEKMDRLTSIITGRRPGYNPRPTKRPRCRQCFHVNFVEIGRAHV